MQPIYPYITVGKTEEQGSLTFAIQDTPIVKVLSMPFLPEEITVDFTIGQKILVKHVEEYLVNGERMYFVHIKDIVSIV